MQIQLITIEKIVPYSQNTRKHSDEQIDRLANGILKYNWTQPIVIDENNVVLAGHGRLLAAKKINATKVPCYVMKDLTEADKRAYRILDNKLAADSEWDIDSLKLELEHLKELDYEMGDVGLDDWEGVEGLEDETQPIEEDEFVEEPPTKIDVVAGDIIRLGDHVVICGDATSANVWIQLIGLQIHPQMMVTDPPYGVEYDPEWREDWDEFKGKRATGKVTNDDQASWLSVFSHFTGDVIYCWHAGRRAAVTAIDLDKAGYEIRTQIIWRKQHFTLSRGNYHWQHEPCWYAVRKGKKSGWNGDRTQSTVWDIANRNPFAGEKEDASTNHSTQKPIECMARPIRNHDFKCIFDPFLGSGSTLIACESLERQCVGFEIEPAYCQMIIDRYRNFCTSQKKDFRCTISGKDYP